MGDPLDRTDAVTADSIWVGLRIPLPIASQWPAEFDQDPHITMVYVGPGTEEQADLVADMVADIVAEIVGKVVEETIEVGGVGYFDNPGERVAYAKVAAPDSVMAAQAELLERVKAAGIEVKHREGPWVPHATLAYLEPDEDYTGPAPSGSWSLGEIEVWRGDVNRTAVDGERMDRFAKRGGKWVALSQDGKTELGTYDTEKEVRERLRQVEAAKAARSDAKPLDDVERQSIIVDFATLVNMTAGEISAWQKSPFAGRNRKSGAAKEKARKAIDTVTDLVGKDEREWSGDDFIAARGIARQIALLSEKRPSTTKILTDGGRAGPTEFDANLKDLGHDPSNDERADGFQLNWAQSAAASERFVVVPVVRQDALGQWEWRTQGDGKVRPEHQALHGVRFDVDDSHPNEGRPGKAFGCRCYPVIVAKRGTAREASAIERAARYAQAFALTRWETDEDERADGVPPATQAAMRVLSEDAPMRAAARALGVPFVHTESRNFTEEMRTDAVELLPAEDLANGWKRYPVLYAKAGNVQVYPHLGNLREYRPHAAVFDPESLALYAGIPWELRHSPNLLTRDTVLGRARGVVMSAEPHTDGIHVSGHSIAWDGGLIDAIDSGAASGVSLAFRVRSVRQPGTTDDGQPFHVWVAKIVPNSLASDPNPRAETARVLTDRLDSADGVTVRTSTELLEIARRGVPSTTPIFFDLRSWHARTDAAEPTTQRKDSNMKIIEMMLAKHGKTAADLAKALGVADADLAKALEDEAMLGKAVEFLMSSPAPAPREDTAGKVKVGDMEYEVDPAVAGYVAKLEEQLSMQEGRADRADAARVKAEADLKVRQDSMAGMVLRQDAIAMAHASALSAGKVLAFHERCGAKEPSVRQDSAGVALPMDLADYKREIITRVYGDESKAILERLDAKPEAIRNELLDDRLIDAEQIWRAKTHTAQDQIESFARNRLHIVENRADSAGKDPIVEAKARQHAAAAEKPGA